MPDEIQKILDRLTDLEKKAIQVQLNPADQENLKNNILDGFMPTLPSGATQTYFQITWKNQIYYIPTGGVVSGISKNGSTVLNGPVTLTAGTNITLTQSGQDITIAETNAPPYSGIFGDGSDGDVTISVDTVITRDMYYNNLTLNSSAKLSGSYRIFVKGTTTIGSGSYIHNNGGNAGNGANGTDATSASLGTIGLGGSGGTAGIAPVAGTLPAGLNGTAANGGNNGVRNNTNGSDAADGGTGASRNPSWGASGVTPSAVRSGSGGSTGSKSGGNGGFPGTPGTATPAINKPKIPHFIINGIDFLSASTFTQILGSAQSPSNAGGAVGGADTNCASGGGGGSGGNGATGGMVMVFSRIIINNASAGIQALGGNAGNAGNGGNGAGTGTAAGGSGGGSGGNGGTGGVVIIVTSTAITGTGDLSNNVNGGTKGTHGTGGAAFGGSGAAGTSGADGVDGVSGVSYTLIVT